MFRKLEFDYVIIILFTENSKLATTETLCITFVVRTVKKKLQSIKVSVINFKVSVTTIFRNAREFCNLPVKMAAKVP